eukprot:3981404-Amphidinium_carterae.1
MLCSPRVLDRETVAKQNIEIELKCYVSPSWGVLLCAAQGFSRCIHASIHVLVWVGILPSVSSLPQIRNREEKIRAQTRVGTVQTPL